MPFFTGPVKPMASSTRSASKVNSVPGSGSTFGDTRTACSCWTLPCSSPVNLTVLTLQSRVPPSSCELSTRNCIGHSGQGVSGERVSQVFHRHVTAHVLVGFELHAFAAHLLQPTVDEVLLHLEIRDTVTQQSADTV